MNDLHCPKLFTMAPLRMISINLGQPTHYMELSHQVQTQLVHMFDTREA